MLVCVAGKNAIAVTVLREVLKRIPAERIVIIPNKTETDFNGWQPSLTACAQELGIKRVDLSSIQEVDDLVFLSMEFDQLIRPSAFKTDRLFNIHFSLLPAYKGMFTSAWPILNGEDHSGVTLHYIDAGIDTGDIIDTIRFPINSGDTARDLYFKYLRMGTRLVVHHLDDLLNTNSLLPRYPQPKQKGSYFSRSSINYKNIEINLRKTAWEVYNQIRAFTFREYQMPSIAGQGIYGSLILEDRCFETPGTIADSSPKSLTIATIDHYVEAYKDYLPEVIRRCRDADQRGVADLLPLLPSLDEHDHEGETPLLEAMRSGHVGIVADLLTAGSSPSVESQRGVRPLDLAYTHPEALSQELESLLRQAGAQSRTHP